MISRDATLRMVCGEAQLGLNNVQEALGQYLAVRASTERRIISTLGPGHGKARVAALTALIYLSMNAVKEAQVIYVFPNEHLKLRDQRAFRESFESANLAPRVHYRAGLDQVPEGLTEKEALLIFDEADCFIFADPERFDKKVGAVPCVCLTATPSADDGESEIEETVLGHLNFALVDGGAVAARELDFDGKLAKEEMARKLREGNETTLVFTSDAEWVKDACNGRPLYINAEALEKSAQSLDAAHGKVAPVLAITDRELMRGVDFRAPLAGITLFLCASLTNKRELQQALGRVGRNGDAARRYLMAGVEAVDRAL